MMPCLLQVRWRTLIPSDSGRRGGTGDAAFTLRVSLRKLPLRLEDIQAQLINAGAKAPVLNFILHQAPDLFIQHPVRLGNEDDIEAQLAVLAEKCHPGIAVLPPKVPAILTDRPPLD